MSEKTKEQIIFEESKDNLFSSKRNGDSLDNKVARLSTLCVTAIGVLSTALVISKVTTLYQIGIVILIIGFFHSLFSLLKAQKTTKYASSGVKAHNIYKHKDYESYDSSDLLKNLSLTHDEMAKHNNNQSSKIAKRVDSALFIIEKYAALSTLVFIIAILFTP